MNVIEQKIFLESQLEKINFVVSKNLGAKLMKKRICKRETNKSLKLGSDPK